MAKKESGPSISLDSFLDVLTCLEGVLMLVIISTGIDAAQTKVLIPTPIEHVSSKKPVYIECRNEQVFPIDVDGLWKVTNERMSALAKTAQGDQMKILQGMSSPEFRITNQYYLVDMTYSLLGQLALKPNPDSTTPGYTIDDKATLSTPGWVNDMFNSIDKDKQRVRLIVRDDSYHVFKTMQRLAFLHKVELSVEVFDSREAIRFGQLASL